MGTRQREATQREATRWIGRVKSIVEEEHAMNLAQGEVSESRNDSLANQRPDALCRSTSTMVPNVG